MTIVEPKITWPLSGSFDFLEGQAGVGAYRMSSGGSDTLWGLIVEPVRLDLHLPARLADRKGAWLRVLSSFSYSAGLVVFPGGFDANAFNRAGPTAPIAGSEAIFEQGIVINLGRIFRGVSGTAL
jgi:hypothetical protein